VQNYKKKGEFPNYFVLLQQNRMTQTIVYILIGINVLTFLVYGIDKFKAVNQRGQSKTRLSYAERKQTRTKSKAKQGGRISEATLLTLAVIGGSIGALLGMRVWHHKTLHKKFKYGLPLILLAQIALIYLIMNN
jgi:uncharacterized membrane protein YsdA (DUF1294 family)